MASGSGKRHRRLVIEGIDPVSGQGCPITVSTSKIRAVGLRSYGQAKESAYCVPAVLQKPAAVFEGLRRDADEPRQGTSAGWRCYSGAPPTAYRKDGEPVAPWPGEVFLVFVAADLVAYDWYWYPASTEDWRVPADHATRFDKRVL